MRSILFSIPLDGQISLGPLGRIPVFGLGALLCVWLAFGLMYLALHVRRHGWQGMGFLPVVWLALAIAIFKAPELEIKNHSIPVYGYGTMLFLGFLASATFASLRLRREGVDGEVAWDVAMWIFISGIVGGRLFYVVQYAPRFFGPDPETGSPRTLGQILFGLVNLPDGGLVLYGSLVFAPLAYFLFCRRRGLEPLALGDILISSVFLGLLFGRLGCFLHGCCYGDFCTLPWGVQFPAHSVPFEALVSRGYLANSAPASLSLRPTQVYDALNGLVLMLLTWSYYPFRRRTGEVLAIGWVAYPFNRFLIEFLRADESGKFGTMLTISQWVSLALFGAGVVYFCWLQTKPAVRKPLVAAGDRHGRPEGQAASAVVAPKQAVQS